MFTFVSEEAGRPRRGYYDTVLRVKTGGDSLFWGDCRVREIKTMTIYNFFEEVFYGRERRMINTLERAVKSIDNYY